MSEYPEEEISGLIAVPNKLRERLTVADPSVASHPELAIIVAMANRRVIGNLGGLPWHIPEDLKHFRETTMGHAIIMGRTTHQSIGKALPGRRNIVLSSKAATRFIGCETATSLQSAISIAREHDYCPFVIGGSSVFDEALPECTVLYITEIKRDFPGDTFFRRSRKPIFTKSTAMRGSRPM
ncbi:MAG: dihydrofolate reductase [Polyangiales bacterium]